MCRSMISPSAGSFAAAHGVRQNQFRSAIGAAQIDLGLAVTEQMDVGRMVIVAEDHRAQAVLPCPVQGMGP